MGRRVAIVGFGSTDNSYEQRKKDDLRPWRTKIADAFYDILANVDKGIDPKDVQYVVTNYHGEASVEGGSPAEIIDALGLAPTGHSLITDQCTGSGTSLFDAYAILASGLHDVVLQIGWDTRYDLLNRADKRSLQSNVDFDYHFGFDHYHVTDIYDVLTYRKYGKRDSLEAQITYLIQSYWYANRNPKAAWYGVPCPIKKDEMMSLLDGGQEEEFWRRLRRAGYLSVDGASGVILVPAEDAKKYTDTPVYIEAVSQKNTPNYVAWPMHYPVKKYPWASIVNAAPGKFDFSDAPAVWLSTEEALKKAKIEPKDADFAEVYDMDIATLYVNLESLRIFPRYQAARFIIEGETAIDGRLPCGTHGGLGGFGKVSGADFSNCLVEAVIQLRGEAGKRQVPKHDVAIVKGNGGVGGGTAMSSTAVLRRE